MPHKSIRSILFAAIAFTSVSSAIHAASPVKMGELNCIVKDTDKTLFKTHMVLACTYVDVNGNNAGNYEATINRTGLK